MGKVIVITGVGRGLGYHIAKRHVEKGDTVYGLEYQLTDELRALEKGHANLHVSPCDVGDDGSVKDAVKGLLAAEKRVDIIYSVAGIFTYQDHLGLAQTETEMCQRYYNVNTLGTLRLGRELWPLIGKGTLVAIVSSEAGSIGAAKRKAEYAYCMSKAALNMMGKLLSNELWEKEGRVIMLHPGWLRTAMGGDRAKQSAFSVEPEDSAADIVNITETIDRRPRDQLFLTHREDLLPW